MGRLRVRIIGPPRSGTNLLKYLAARHLRGARSGLLGTGGVSHAGTRLAANDDALQGHGRVDQFAERAEARDAVES